MYIIKGVPHTAEEVEACIPMGFSGQDDEISIAQIPETRTTAAGHRIVTVEKTFHLADILYNPETGLCAIVIDEIAMPRWAWELLDDPSREIPPEFRGMWEAESSEEWYNSPEEMAASCDIEWLARLIGYLPNGTSNDRTVAVKDGTPQAEFACRILRECE